MNGILIMEFSVRAAELTTLLENRITNFYTNFQVDEIGRVVSVGDGIARVYGSTFFLATGFHGFHVIIGTLFLIICGIRQYLGHLTKEHHVGFEAAAWYWHFVDVVRLFPFVSKIRNFLIFGSVLFYSWKVLFDLLNLGYLHMDELQQAVAPFLPSSTSGGGFNQPPAPGPGGESPEFWFAVAPEQHPGGEQGALTTKEQTQVLKGADRQERAYQIFIQQAAELVKNEGLPLEDPEDVRRVAEIVLEGKGPRQLQYASRAIFKPHSTISKQFLKELRAFLS